MVPYSGLTPAMPLFVVRGKAERPLTYKLFPDGPKKAVLKAPNFLFAFVAKTAVIARANAPTAITIFDFFIKNA